MLCADAAGERLAKRALKRRRVPADEVKARRARVKPRCKPRAELHVAGGFGERVGQDGMEVCTLEALPERRDVDRLGEFPGEDTGERAPSRLSLIHI